MPIPTDSHTLLEIKVNGTLLFVGHITERQELNIWKLVTEMKYPVCNANVRYGVTNLDARQ